MSTTAELLKVALHEATGDKVRRVWWMPLGPSVEMQGPQGGWMYETEKHGEDCLGINAEMAIRLIVNMAAIRARQEQNDAR